MSLNFASNPIQPSAFEVEGIVCADCNAPLQEAPTWAENRGQSVYRCPWTSRRHIRVEHNEPEILIFNCRWEKGNVARRLSEAVR